MAEHVLLQRSRPSSAQSWNYVESVMPRCLVCWAFASVLVCCVERQSRSTSLFSRVALRPPLVIFTVKQPMVARTCTLSVCCNAIQRVAHYSCSWAFTCPICVSLCDFNPSFGAGAYVVNDWSVEQRDYEDNGCSGRARCPQLRKRLMGRGRPPAPQRPLSRRDVLVLARRPSVEVAIAATRMRFLARFA